MVKVLLCGDIGSNWNALYERLTKLNSSSHGPFEFVLSAGSCDVACCSIEKWPIPLYVMGNDTNNKSKNLHVVTENTVLELSGLHVAFIINAKSIEGFDTTLQAKSIDLLLSNEYPQGFDQLVTVDAIPEPIRRVGLKAITDIVQVGLPRYHIVGTHGIFYQRPPYVTTKESNRRITRLIGLGHVGASTDKDKKWMHALNLDVLPSNASIDIPSGTTQNPFETLKRQIHDIGSTNSRKRLHAGLSEEKARELMEKHTSHQNHSFYDHREHALLPNRQECWFCLSTPTVEMHLIVSIGEEAYLAIPKGPIVPDHVLIVPIQHVASMQNIDTNTKNEIDRFKATLRRYFSSQGKATIIIDRNVTTAGASHCHLQVIPVPESMVPAIPDAFHDEGEKYKMEFRQLNSNENILENEYLLVEYPSTEEDKIDRLLHVVNGKHYMQFGRDVVAALINAPKRGNWKYCVVSKEDEENMTINFKNLFKSFDFTLNE